MLRKILSIISSFPLVFNSNLNLFNFLRAKKIDITGNVKVFQEQAYEKISDGYNWVKPSGWSNTTERKVSGNLQLDKGTIAISNPYKPKANFEYKYNLLKRPNSKFYNYSIWAENNNEYRQYDPFNQVLSIRELDTDKVKREIENVEPYNAFFQEILRISGLKHIFKTKLVEESTLSNYTREQKAFLRFYNDTQAKMHQIFKFFDTILFNKTKYKKFKKEVNNWYTHKDYYERVYSTHFVEFIDSLVDSGITEQWENNTFTFHNFRDLYLEYSKRYLLENSGKTTFLKETRQFWRPNYCNDDFYYKDDFYYNRHNCRYLYFDKDSKPKFKEDFAKVIKTIQKSAEFYFNAIKDKKPFPHHSDLPRLWFEKPQITLKTIANIKGEVDFNLANKKLTSLKIYGRLGSDDGFMSINSISYHYNKEDRWFQYKDEKFRFDPDANTIIYNNNKIPLNDIQFENLNKLFNLGVKINKQGKLVFNGKEFNYNFGDNTITIKNVKYKLKDLNPKQIIDLLKGEIND